MNFREMKRPSLTSSGTRIPAKSTCPQGCAQYEAKVRLGAMVLPMLPAIGPPAPVHGTPLQSAEIGVGAPGPPGSAPTFESEDKIPAGVIMEVVGCSADTENALPQGPAIVSHLRDA